MIKKLSLAALATLLAGTLIGGCAKEPAPETKVLTPTGAPPKAGSNIPGDVVDAPPGVQTGTP